MSDFTASVDPHHDHAHDHDHAVAGRRFPARALLTRWLGTGITAAICVVTVGLAATGKLALYINPDGSWFAVVMAVVGLLAIIGSCVVPFGEETDHGHDHGGSDDNRSRGARFGSALATGIGAVLASAIVVLMLVVPPASLSSQAAADRDIGSPPLFGGAESVMLASRGDTDSFGIGEWATAFATSGDPGAFIGQSVTITGFVTASESDATRLGRLVVTHCVIDAQPASVELAEDDRTAAATAGQWLTVEGTIAEQPDGKLVIVPNTVTEVAEPADPYEY